MADPGTIKQAIAQAAIEAAKVMFMAVNEENQRQAMEADHQNATEIIRHELEDITETTNKAKINTNLGVTNNLLQAHERKPIKN